MTSTSNSTPEALRKLKCDLCEHYLSVPPISVISNDGQKYKCGRCKDINTTPNIRLVGFEDVIKVFKFPCIYKDCQQQLSWNEVKQHEEVCQQKTLQCNVENCEDTVKISEIERHYINVGHDENHLVYETFYKKNIKFNIDLIYLCIKNNIKFLIYIKTVPSNFWISVFCLTAIYDKNLRYSVKLSPENLSDCSSLLCEDQKIIPFKEREHCARCIFQKCDVKFHKIPQKAKEDFRTTKIQHNDVKKFSKSPSFTCKIKFFGDIASDLKEDQMPVHISSSMNLLRQSLQCPICTEYMIARIYTCNIGHVICNVCKMMVKNECPLCKGRLGETRNFVLESMAESVELTCQFDQEGCEFVGQLDRLRRHEATCSFGI